VAMRLVWDMAGNQKEAAVSRFQAA